jgi:hypothetical protein
MSGEGFEFDMKDFDKRFTEIALTAAPAAAENGMFAALSELKRDADTVYPKTPHLEGNLRGDFSLVLEGITQSKVVNRSGGKGSDHGERAKPTERIGAKEIIAKIIFRMPYAAKWHEAIDKDWAEGGIKWSESGVGPKYLESKLAMFKQKYYGIVAAAVRAAIGNGPKP